MPFPVPFRERRFSKPPIRPRRLDARTHVRALANLGGESGLLVPSWALGSESNEDAARARHTATAVALGRNRLWPRWILDQLDRDSAAFTHPGAESVVQNVTGRSWTRIGTLDKPGVATVDGDGLVTPVADGPSLDWWVRDADGWRFPSRDSTISQALVDATPVVRTEMQITHDHGGIVSSTAYGAAGDPAEIVVEIANETQAPLAVAFALRPYNLEGVSIVAGIEVTESEISVNGDLWARLPEGASDVMLSTFRAGDVAERIAGREAKRWSGAATPVKDPAGLATAAVIFPLRHDGALRIVLPVREPLQRRKPQATITSTPHADAVARGWRTQTREAASFAFADDRFSDALDAQRQHLTLLHRGGWSNADRADAFPELAFVLRALGQLGRQDLVADALSEIARRSGQHRFLLGREDNWDALASSVIALGDHWRLTKDDDTVDEVFETVDLLVDAVRSSSIAPGAQARRNTPEFLGPPDAYFWDTVFALAGLRDAIMLADLVGSKVVAARAREQEDALFESYTDMLDACVDRLSTQVMPAGPGRGLDAGAIGSLAACYPLGLLSADDPRVAATRDWIYESFVADGRYFHPIAHNGFSSTLAVYLAGSLLSAGDSRGWVLVDGLIEHASPTWTWPEAVHPHSGRGCFGAGHDAWAAAAFTTLMRDACVRESGDGLALFSFVPADWRGGDIKVEGARTRFGSLDLHLTESRGKTIMQWRGLWGAETPRLTAPAIDSRWSTDEPAGIAEFA